MRSKRAQISMEYLVIVGLSLFLLIPMIVIFYDQSSSLQDDINAVQIEKIALEVIDAAEEVYYLGPPSQKFLNVYLPQHVNNIDVNEQELVFNYTTSSGHFAYPVSTELPLNMTGTIKTFLGKHRISVQATEQGVNISDVS